MTEAAAERVVVVTGGARGIGAAISAALAADQWTVAVWDLDLEAASATAKQLTELHGVDARGFGVDISQTAQVGAAATLVESTLGPVYGLVNNAGVDVIKSFVDSTEDEWDRVIAVNLKGTISCCRAVLDPVDRGASRPHRVGRLRRRSSGLLGGGGLFRDERWRDRLHQDPGA